MDQIELVVSSKVHHSNGKLKVSLSRLGSNRKPQSFRAFEESPIALEYSDG